MAVIGVQLVISMVMASVLSRISPHRSFGRWVLCSKLVRYLHPSDEELKKLGGIPPGGSKQGKNRYNKHDKGDQKEKESFSIPRNIALQLDSAPITANDVVQLRFYTEYQWLLDFAISGIIIYLLTELYYALFQPKGEFNLSMLWCLLVIGFCLKLMYSVTAIYFRTEEGGERIMCIVFTFFFLVMAMGILIVDEEILEFGLEVGYKNFSDGAQKFLLLQGIESAGPATLLTFKVLLAIVSAILGGFLTFPGLRLAKMFSDSLKYAKERPFMKLLLHMNIILPLFISTMWLKPVVRQYLVKRDYRGQWAYGITDEGFDSIRIIVIVVFCLFRFLLIWTHLQSHLNMACEKIEKLKKEAGRITAIELQKMVAHVFYYLSVVTLQYVTPIILLLYCVFMLKTMGDFSFVNQVRPQPQRTPSPIPAQPTIPLASNSSDISTTAAQFSLALTSLRQVFTPLCFRGLFSYFCWWICQAWFTTSAFGIVFYTYFEGY